MAPLRRIPVILIAAWLAMAGIGMRQTAAGWHHHEPRECGHDHGHDHRHDDHRHGEDPRESEDRDGPGGHSCAICVAISTGAAPASEPETVSAAAPGEVLRGVAHAAPAFLYELRSLVPRGPPGALLI